MKVLSIDTATTLASVAALSDGKTAGTVSFAPARGHSEHLLESVRSLLSRLGWRVADIDLFVGTTGPGSFTGLRIGLGTVHGMSVAAGRPAVGVSTLRAMAGVLGGPGGRIAPSLDAGRGEIYVGLYHGEYPPEPLEPEAVMKPGELPRYLGREPVLVLGPGLEVCGREPGAALPETARPLAWQGSLAGAAARLALRLLERGVPAGEMPLAANYVRRSDARLPGAG